MKLVKKSIILIILLNIVFVTCVYAESNNSVLISNTAINNDYGNTINLVENPNADDYVHLEKNYIEDYFASIAVEKESVTDFMSKIEGNKVLTS